MGFQLLGIVYHDVNLFDLQQIKLMLPTTEAFLKVGYLNQSYFSCFDKHHFFNNATDIIVPVRPFPPLQ